MRGLVAFCGFQLECGAWRPLETLAGMQGLAAFGNSSWNAGILVGMRGLATFGDFS
jgi:hypothetical protein